MAVSQLVGAKIHRREDPQDFRHRWYQAWSTDEVATWIESPVADGTSLPFNFIAVTQSVFVVLLLSMMLYVTVFGDIRRIVRDRKAEAQTKEAAEKLVGHCVAFLNDMGCYASADAARVPNSSSPSDPILV